MSIETCFYKNFYKKSKGIKRKLTKTELIKYVAQSTNNTVKDTGEIVDEFIDYIKKALHEHEEVTIHGFGRFDTKLRDPRTARNPRTGETIEVPAKYAVTFKPVSSLKELVNE